MFNKEYISLYKTLDGECTFCPPPGNPLAHALTKPWLFDHVLVKKRGSIIAKCVSNIHIIMVKAGPRRYKQIKKEMKNITLVSN